MSKEENPLWQTNTITVWSVSQKKHVNMTLEESVKDIVDNHEKVDYTVSRELFDSDPAGVKKMMKSNGYYSTTGCTFQHYTRKVK